MFRESIKMSWANIVHNRVRSFLTILGIVIGVASIIALVSIVQGATGSITSRISALGADRISIHASGTPIKKGLSESELSKLSQIEYVRGLSPTVSGKTTISYEEKIKTGVIVKGKNHFYFRAEGSKLLSGRGFNALDIENRTKVAIIGSDIVSKFFMGENPVGQTIRINGHTYTVIGMLKQSGIFEADSINNTILIPYTSAMRTLGVRGIIDVDVYMSDSDKSQQVISAIRGVLNEAFNYREEAFYLYYSQDLINTIGSVTMIMSLLLAGIASISLIVGGIGIMNMMLVSVTERTSEIGLRKALGAEPSRIQLQFLMESIFLSLFGGMIGFGVGAFIAFLASNLIGFEFQLSYWVILIAVGFSALIGIAFGLAPARKASRLNPIVALRHV